MGQTGPLAIHRIIFDSAATGGNRSWVRTGNPLIYLKSKKCYVFLPVSLALSTCHWQITSIELEQQTNLFEEKEFLNGFLEHQKYARWQLKTKKKRPRRKKMTGLCNNRTNRNTRTNRNNRLCRTKKLDRKISLVEFNRIISNNMLPIFCRLCAYDKLNVFFVVTACH